MTNSRFADFLLFHFIYGSLVVVFTLERVYWSVPTNTLPALPEKTFHRHSQLSCVHKCARRKQRCVFKKYSDDSKEGDCILYNEEKFVKSKDSGVVALQYFKPFACQKVASSKRFEKGEDCDNFIGGSSATKHNATEFCSSLFTNNPSLQKGFFWNIDNSSTAQTYCDKSVVYGEFSSNEGRRLSRNQLITTMPKFPKTYSISFSMKFTEMLFNEKYYSVLQLTEGNNERAVGNSILGIWTMSNDQLYVSAPLNGVINSYVEIPFFIETSVWTAFNFDHLEENGKFWFKVSINGSTVVKKQNNSPFEFENVKFYAASNWYTTQQGVIRNLLIQTY